MRGAMDQRKVLIRRLCTFVGQPKWIMTTLRPMPDSPMLMSCLVISAIGRATRCFPKPRRLRSVACSWHSTLPSAHPALAYELAWERDFAGADSEFRKAIAFDPTYATAQAIAFDPTYATAHQWYAILLMILGQNPQAVMASGRAAEQDPFSLNVPVIEVAFTKWITTYPALAGFTSYGPGTIAGQVLNRIDDGAFTHLSARYEVTDPSGSHSFKAVIQGKVNNKTGSSELNGIVTWGWMIGARVRVTFVRVTPCEFGKTQCVFPGHPTDSARIVPDVLKCATC